MGTPNSGRIRAKSGANAGPNDCVKANGKYNTETTRKVCVLYFQL